MDLTGIQCGAQRHLNRTASYYRGRQWLPHMHLYVPDPSSLLSQSAIHLISYDMTNVHANIISYPIEELQ